MSTPTPTLPKEMMKQMIGSQAIPQIDMIVKIFDANSADATKAQKCVRDAAVNFRDALQEWVEEK